MRVIHQFHSLFMLILRRRVSRFFCRFSIVRKMLIYIYRRFTFSKQCNHVSADIHELPVLKIYAEFVSRATFKI